ncbi:MAG TPA: hypothetical protein VH092_16520 [Urbifossiella sp.]|nr:hypothetical protein [Urbifossiella sp.]
MFVAFVVARDIGPGVATSRKQATAHFGLAVKTTGVIVEEARRRSGPLDV